MRRVGLLLPLLALSCGYRVGSLVAHRDVGLEIFDNRTERRTHEFDLSALIAREMAGAGIAVNTPEAPVNLVGNIVNFDEPAIVETGEDDVLIGSVSIRVELSLVDARDGRVLWTDSRAEAATFATARGESKDTAKQEVYARLARWAVSKLEKEW